LRSRVTVRLKDGAVRRHTVQGFPGLPSHPFTWQDAVDKFDHLVDGRLVHLDTGTADQ
jgi:2-methylcitrate dehydratase